jgi:hypothetical protein
VGLVLRLALPLALVSCTSWSFDDSAPFAVLRGNPPSIAGRQQLVRPADADPVFVRGVDGVQWLLQPVSPNPAYAFEKLVRLGEPRDEMMIAVGGFNYVTSGATLDVDFDIDDTTMKITASHLTLTRPGGAPIKFDFEGYIGGNFTDSDDESALYLNPGQASADHVGAGFLLQTDGSYRRAIPVTDDPTAVLSPDGEFLILFDVDGAIRAHATRQELDVVLGPWQLDDETEFYARAPQVTFWRGLPQITVCDQFGLRTLQLEPPSSHTLDADPCVPGGLSVKRDRFVYYAQADAKQQLRSVPLDGSAPPMTPAHADSPPLAVDTQQVAWSTRPQSGPGGTYMPYDGDGWVGDAQFMERGRNVSFSADGRHLYFLEHSATSAGTGELRSYEIATGITHVLALNTKWFQELSDGRMMAVTNAEYKGDWNRVVVIDEARRTIDWVADRADSFTLIPGSQDVLVDLVSDGGDVPLLRVPIPPRAP